MPTKRLPEQNGNSCAAHCTTIAINEIKQTALTATFAEDDLWPSIQFSDTCAVTKPLADDKNSDPRLIVSQIKQRWPGVKAKLLCDEGQKSKAISMVNGMMRSGMNDIFNLLVQEAVKGSIALDEAVFYNCSYTMHSGAKPSEDNFSGMHNILVAYEAGKTFFYNSNESNPQWQATANWKKLEAQNGGTHSYVFSGVAVAIF
ncbi:hypothetical protein [Aliamphritea spongicola]|uniref:hypothetical protein n=1 Tax=Aliamphritea spongicola TaxID=707589 RepID=UPI00196B1C93|nr:hypothetical protein [Aliamphritea spongicola]MBN3561968.1 hypothetical protein [Aliamphritea spongicola]